MHIDLKGSKKGMLGFFDFQIAGDIDWVAQTMKDGTAVNVDLGGIAPAWCDFYEVKGDLRIDSDPDPSEWVTLRSPSLKSRHFLFYLRDETFECDAESWSLVVGSETIDQ